MDHCVEGLCSLHLKNGAAFERALVELVPSLLATKQAWGDTEPRLRSMMGVVDAMRGLREGVSMGGSHGIGHQLGPLGVGHGETSCIMLPAVLKFNYLHGDERVRALQGKVLDIFWAEATIAEVLTRRGLEREMADAGDVVAAVISELGMPRTLKDVGVGREKLDALAENSLKDACLATNPVPLTKKEQVLEILEAVVGDEKSS